MRRAHLAVTPKIWTVILLSIYFAIGIPGLRRTMVGDEIYALLAAGKTFREHIEFLRLDLLHPPLAHLLIRGWLELFGNTDLSAKLWALLLNACTVVLTVALAVRVTPHWRLASFLMCVPCLQVGSAVHLLRNYGLLYAVTLAVALVWDWWRREPGNRSLICLTATLVAALYTSMLSILILPALVAANRFFGNRQRAFERAVGIAMLLLQPWLLVVMPVYLNRKLAGNLGWLRTSPHIALAGLPYDLLSGADPGNDSLPYPFSERRVRVWLVGPAALLNAALAFAVWRKQRTRWRLQGPGHYSWTAICVMVAASPCLALWAGSLLGHPLLHGRYILFIAPFYWLLVAQGVFLGGTWGKAIFGAGFAPWIAASILAPFVLNVAASPVRIGTTELTTRLQADDLILFDMNSHAGWQAYWEWTHRLGRSDHVAAAGTGILPHEAVLVPLQVPENISLPRHGQVFLFSVFGPSRKRLETILNNHGYGPVETIAPSTMTRFEQTAEH